MKGKKKVLIALLAAFCMSTAAAGFAACGEETQGKTDPHAYADANGDALCDDCGKIKGDSIHVFDEHVFADADNDNVCDVCGREIGQVKDPPEGGEKPPVTPEAKTYTVTFDTQGGNSLPQQGVKEGEKAQQPEAPVKDNYEFDGWYQDSDCTQAFDFGKALDGNVTVYAKWKDAAATADTYFDFEEVEGGVSIAAKANVTLPRSVVLPSAHDGKAVVAIGSSAFEQQPALRTVKIPASIKSIGQYAFRNCTALETVNGGENLEDVGYGAFANTAWDLNFPVGEVYLGKTLYKYAGSLYTDTQITVKDGTVGVSAGAFEGLTHLVGITLPETVKTIGSRAFEGTGLLSVTVKSAEAPKLGNSVLGAAAAFGGKIFVPVAALGSYKEASGWKTYANKIYAQGTAEQTYVVTFSAEGATGVPAAQNVKGFEKATSPAEKPAKDGFEFGGWYLDAACTLPYDFDSEVTESLTLYGKFGKYYNVSFSTGTGASTVETQRVEEGYTAAQPQAPTKDGNEFMGWFKDEACTKKFDFTDPVGADTTVYAKFLPSGENYTGEGDYEGWVIENGRVKEYTGSKTDIKIPKQLTRLDSITEIIPAPAFSTTRTGDLTKINSITVDPENEYFKVEGNALLSRDGTVLYFQFAMKSNPDLSHPDVVRVAPYAFYKSALTAGNMASALKLGEVEEVGEYAFFGSTGLTNFEPFKTAKTIGAFAFYDTQFKTIESDAKTIGRCAFTVSGSTSAIQTMVLHNIETIESYAIGFNVTNGSSGNSRGSLKTLVIGPNVKTIPRSAFGTTVSCRVILESNKLVGVLPGAFNGQSTSNFRLYVKEALFEDFKSEGAFLKYKKGYYTDDGWYFSVDSGTTRFTYEGSYESVKIPASLAFMNDILDIFGTAENLDKCKTLTLTDGSEAYKMQDGALLSADGKTLYAYFGNGTGDLSSVTEIKPYAFYNKLKTQGDVAAASNGLVFGQLETVGKYAFYGCNALTDFTPFRSLTAITEHSFEGTGFTSLTFNNVDLASIQRSAFENCENLTSVYVKMLAFPSVAEKAFGEQVKLYVPYEYADQFMIIWALYIEQIEGDENTHVYTVEFTDGDRSLGEQVVLSGEKAVLPETPEKKGSFFFGWSMDEDVYVAYNFSMPVNSNVTLYALWTDGYTLSFTTGDKASQVDDMTVLPDALAEKPADPVWDGYVFGGWYRDKNCTSEFDFSKDVVEGDLHLYAKWSQGYTVKFEAGKGSEVGSQAVLPDSTPVRPDDPTLDGYKFAGWWTKDGTNGDWGSEYTFDTKVDGDLQLYAKWTENFWDLDENGKLLHYYGPYGTVKIPAALKSFDSIFDIFGSQDNYSACTSIEVDGENTAFKAVNNALLSYDGTILYAFFGGAEESYTWDSVTVIGDYAFFGHFNTDAELTFSADLASVGAHAFEETAITSFKPFENVLKIGEYAFVGSQLVDINWNVSGEIPSNTFTNIVTLKTITFMNASSIGKEAFAGCNKIATITLGANMKTIGQSAFWDAGQADTIKDINMYATTPPTLTGGGSSNTHPLGGDKSYGTWKPHFTVHVYKNSWSAYTSTSLTGWNWYKTSQYVAFTVDVTLHMGEAEGEVEAPSVTGYLNTALTKPTVPAWNGKTLVGWYTDETLETEFNFRSPLKGDVELWAKWGDGFAFHFNTGEDGPSVADQVVLKDGKATRPTNPTKTGYFFDGWYTTDKFETEYDFTKETVTKETTVYAKWTKGLNVTFNTDGGSTTGITNQNVRPGGTATKPTRTPTKTGYTFEGWYLKTEAGEFEEEAFDFATELDKDLEIFAKWTKNLTVTFDTDGGSTTAAQTVYPGKTATKPATNPTKTGYSFDGWYLKTGEEFAKEAFDFGTAITADTTIYAKWTQNVNVKFELNGGTSTAIKDQSIRPGTTATKPASDPTKTGYFFDGWYTKNGTDDNEWGTEFDFKSAVSEETTVYAKWTQGVNVNFSTGDGSKVAAQNVRPNTNATKPATDPTLKDYYFDGWYKDEGCETVFDFDKEVITEETTVYAKWTKGVKVTFSTGEGASKVDEQQLYPGKTAAKPGVDPAWTGHLFDGWYKDEDCTEVFDFTVGVTQDTTVYAKWKDGLTVTFETDGGSDVPVQTLGEGSKAVRPAADPTKTGYLFLGWYEKNGKEDGNWGSKFDFGTEIHESTTLYARWLENFWQVDETGKLTKYLGPTDVEIEIPANVKGITSILDIYDTAANLKNAVGLKVSPLNKYFKIVNNALLNADGTVLYFYLGGAENLEWNTVTTIGDYAFYGKLTDATKQMPVFSAELAKIGTSAFENCTGITSFKPFEDFETLGANAFSGTGLTEVVWNTHGSVTAAFNNITTLKKVVLMNATTVAANAFKGCTKITDIVIGPNVTTIGSAAFYSAGNAKSIKTITVYAIKPPTLTGGGSNNTHPLGGDNAKKTFLVYVPNSALSAYKATSLTGWNWYNGSSGSTDAYRPITVNLTMHMGKGDGVPQAPEVNAYWNEKLASPIPEKWKGHVFEGWYADAALSARFNFSAKLTEDVELWAKWSDGYYVEFDSKGGSDVDWIPVRGGEKVEKPEDPYLLGSEFVGWFTKDGSNDDWGTEFSFDDPITANVKLYAKWNKGYAVTFDLGYSGAKEIAGQTIMPTDADRHAKKPTDPTRTNWVFEGWWTKNGAEDNDWGTEFNFEETEIAADTVLYAKWNPWVINADGSLKAYGGDKKNIEIPLAVKSIPNAYLLFGTSYSSIPSDFTGYSIKVAEGHTAFQIKNDMLLDIEGKVCYLYIGTGTTADLTGVTEVKSYAFYNKTNLKSMTSPDLVTVGDRGFYGCGFETLTLEKVETLGQYAFSSCTSLTSVTLNAVKTIGQYGFYSDSKLETVVIGENCTSIGNFTFRSCTKLISADGSITVKATKAPTLGGTSVFGTASSFKGTIYVPEASVSAYQAANRWSNLKAHIEAIT